MTELQELFKSEGIEILNHVTKELEPKEMFFLKNRIESQQAKKISEKMGTFFQNINSHNELKLNGGMDELMMNMMSQDRIIKQKGTGKSNTIE